MENELHQILEVDDLSNWRLSLGGILVDHGYRVECASSASDAIKVLYPNKFNLVLIDVLLDETDENDLAGLDTCTSNSRILSRYENSNHYRL